jgi:hypothetical protein
VTTPAEEIIPTLEEVGAFLAKFLAGAPLADLFTLGTTVYDAIRKRSAPAEVDAAIAAANVAADLAEEKKFGPKP